MIEQSVDHVEEIVNKIADEIKTTVEERFDYVGEIVNPLKKSFRTQS